MVGTKKKLFLCFSSSKNLEIIVWRSCPPSQSIGRGRISREGALDHRESRERRDKIFAEKTENAKNFKKIFWIRKTGKQRFQWGTFIFLAAGKLTFLEGGITSKLASQWPSWGIYKHAPPVFWRKRKRGISICYNYIQKKVWPNKNLFLGRPAIVYL